MKNDNESEVYLALISYIREVSWVTPDMTTEIMIGLNMIPDLLKFTIADNVTDIMIELTWIIVNISSTDNKDFIDALLNSNRNGDFNVVEFLIEMTNHSDYKIKEQSFWALANLWQEDDQNIIEYVSNSKAIDEMINMTNKNEIKMSIIKQIAFLISHLTKLK